MPNILRRFYRWIEESEADEIKGLTWREKQLIRAGEDLVKDARAEMRERAAKLCDKFDAPVSDSEFVNAQAIAAQQIRAAIRALPLDPETGGADESLLD